MENTEISDSNNIAENDNETEIEDEITENETEDIIEDNETIIENVDEEDNTTNDVESSDLVEVEELEPVSNLESPVAVDENPKIESNNKNESIDSSIVDENKPSTKIIFPLSLLLSIGFGSKSQIHPCISSDDPFDPDSEEELFLKIALSSIIFVEGLSVSYTHLTLPTSDLV